MILHEATAFLKFAATGALHNHPPHRTLLLHAKMVTLFISSSDYSFKVFTLFWCRMRNHQCI